MNLQAGGTTTPLAAGPVAAIHFCRSENAYSLDPRRFVLSLAYQLTAQIPDYDAALQSTAYEALTNDARIGAQTLADELMVKLLPRCEQRRVIVVDGLDEATVEGRNVLAQLVKGELLRTPEWLRFLVTSPGAAHGVRAAGIQGAPAECGTDANLADARTYIHKEFDQYAKPPVVPAATVEAILDRSEGMFLYLVWLGYELATGRLTLQDVNAFPRGLGAAYSSFFERQFGDTTSFRRQYRAAIAAILAAREPLDTGSLARLLGWTEDERYDRVSALGAMFVDSTADLCRPFHKSLKEWIADRQKAGPYRVSTAEGEEILASRSWGLFHEAPGTAPAYVLRHLPSHLAAVPAEDRLRSLLLEFSWLSRKLRATGVYSVLADYGLLPVLDGAPALIVQTLRLSLTALAQDATQLPAQLLGRIPSMPDPEIRALLDAARAFADGVWLRPRSASLVHAGTTLIERLAEPDGLIATAALSGDGVTAALVRTDDHGVAVRGVRVRKMTANGTTLNVHSAAAHALALSFDGSLLAVAETGSHVALWALAQDSPHALFAFDAGDEPVVALSFADADRLLTIGQHGAITTWVLGANDAVRSRTVALAEPLGESDLQTRVSVAVAPVGERLFIGRSSIWGTGQIAEWHLDTGALIQRHPFPQFERIMASPDGKTLVLADTEISIWTRRGGRYALRRALARQTFLARGLAISADGARILSCHGTYVCVWDGQSAAPNPLDSRSEDAVGALAVRHDGKQALAKFTQSGWKLLDLTTGQLSAIDLPEDAVPAGDSYDESHVTLAARNGDVLVRRWADRRLRVLASPVKGKTVAVSPDHRVAVTRVQDSYVIWATSTSAERLRVPVPPPSAVIAAVTDDGAYVAIGGDFSIAVCDIDRGAPLRVLVGARSFVDCLAVAVTPKGVRVVAAARDRYLRVWDPELAQPLLTLSGHTYTISDVKFMPDKEHVVSCGGDNTLRLWSLRTGQCEAVYTADAWLTHCVPTPDGRTIVAADMSGALHVVDVVGNRPSRVEGPVDGAGTQETGTVSDQ